MDWGSILGSYGAAHGNFGANIQNAFGNASGNAAMMSGMLPGGPGSGGGAGSGGSSNNRWGNPNEDPYGRQNPLSYNDHNFMKGIQAQNGEQLRQQQALSRGTAGQNLSNQIQSDQYTQPNAYDQAMKYQNLNFRGQQTGNLINNNSFYQRLPGVQSILGTVFGTGGQGGGGTPQYTQVPTQYGTNFGGSGGLTPISQTGASSSAPFPPSYPGGNPNGVYQPAF